MAPGRTPVARSSAKDVFVVVHRYVGLASLLFLFLAAASGCVLIFFNTLDATLNPDLFRCKNSGAVLSAPVLAGIIQREHSDIRVVSLPLQVGATRNVEMKVVSRSLAPIGYDEIYVNPHDGRLVATRDDEAIVFDRHHIMPMIYIFHYTLLAGDFGRLFMGAVAVIWLLENLMGFYLTLPRKPPFWTRWKTMWQIRRGTAWPRFLLDLHQASGLWLFAALVLYSITSFSLNFYYEAVAPAVLAISPREISPFDAPSRYNPVAHLPTLSFGDALALGRRAAISHDLKEKPAWLTYNASHGLYAVEFTPDGAATYSGYGPIAYYFDDHSGAFIFTDDPGADSTGQWLLRSIFPLHSGQIGGWITEAIVFILGLSVMEMCVSGLIVWWKKRRPRKAAKRAL